MNTKRFFISGIAGGIVSFFAGWLIYGMLLMNFMSTNTVAGLMRSQDEMVWWALILGNIALGFLFSYIFNKWAGITTASAGIMGGAVIAFFTTTGNDLIMYATSNETTLNGVWIDIAASIVIGAIVGGVIGFVNGKVK